MLKILIIEDEAPSAKRLLKMIKEIEPDIELMGTLGSVSDAINWFRNNNTPELIFSDIQLSDGLSFEIYREIKLLCPVIFVTAYDQYAIEAFKVNSIDYLLKPIKKAQLEAAVDKFKELKPVVGAPAFDIEKLLQAYSERSNPYRDRIAVRYGDHIKTINAGDIAYFNTEDKVNFLTTHDARRYILDFNLDSVEAIVDPKMFFRINRQFIISINAITEMLAYTKSRVLVKLKPVPKAETVVSTDRSADFKIWLGAGKISS
ncbi:MAG: response regulator transcription factor [Chitinophagaceae bacterium]|nr:response regulator transcription factor [Chitinophagaceae bacterium]